jgi:hypothetical protein
MGIAALAHCDNCGVADDPDVPNHPVQNAEQIWRGHQRISNDPEMPGFGLDSSDESDRGIAGARKSELPQKVDLIDRKPSIRVAERGKIQTGVAKQSRHIKLLDRQCVRDAGHPERGVRAPIDIRWRRPIALHLASPKHRCWPTSPEIWPTAPLL